MKALTHSISHSSYLYNRKSHIEGLIAATSLIAIMILLLWLMNVGTSASTPVPKFKAPLARLSERVSVQAAGRGNPWISLADGRDVITPFSGPPNLVQALENNQVEPLSLAASDFDEDGIPDLISGYASSHGGIVTLMRGNVDAIYQNAPEAQQRRAEGTYTDSPFLGPAYVFAVPEAVDFVGAGDFDGDSHWDVVTAARGGEKLYLLSGDGKGNLDEPQETRLPGKVTAMTVGEINRRDGIDDLAVGVSGPDGAKVLVFEGPDGALRSRPEILNMPTEASSLALGQLDNSYEMDLAIGAGSEVIIVYGRDRKLSLDVETRNSVELAATRRYSIPTAIRSIAIGNFISDHKQEIALLLADGRIDCLVESQNSNQMLEVDRYRYDSSLRLLGGDSLVPVRISTCDHDDLLVIDSLNKSMHLACTGLSKITGPGSASLLLPSRNRSFNLPMELLNQPRGLKSEVTEVVNQPGLTSKDILQGQLSETVRDDLPQSRSGGKQYDSPLDFTFSLRTSFNMESNSTSVIPLRMNSDGLCDLVVLRESNSFPTVMQSMDEINVASGHIMPQALTFTNSTAIIINDIGSASPYPSTINVSGLAGTISKVSVTLYGISHSYPDDIDILLIGPDGSRTLLMSDVGGPNAINNFNITFDDDATSMIPDHDPILPRSYKPSDVNDGSDTFAPPALGGPYGANLSVFAGTLPNGTWSLYVVDDTLQDSGVIAMGWSLNIGTGRESGPITVTNTSDRGPGSLREAILNANVNPGPDTIRFNISGAAPHTIRPAFPLPAITDTTLIDGTTEPSFAGSPVVELSGEIVSGLGTGFFGLEIDASNCVIRGLSINRFRMVRSCGQNCLQISGTGILLVAVSNCIVESNFIGTDISGRTAQGNSFGILVFQGANNTIGGSTQNARNIVSGQGGVFEGEPVPGDGIAIVRSGAIGNKVQGNFIGPDVTGSVVISRNTEGILVSPFCTNDLIGGTTPGVGNLISGNGGGINIAHSQGILVQGNLIGTSPSGRAPLSNGLGIFIQGDSSNNLIGGTITSARNIISGSNPNGGVHLNGETVVNTLIQGNFIGTDITGTVSLGNNFNGVDIFFAPDNVIGGTSTGARNLISGNRRNGISIGVQTEAGTTLGGARRVIVQGNVIGSDISGRPLGNGIDGVFIDASGSVDCRIGGVSTEEKNIIAFNGRNGVFLPNTRDMGESIPAVRIRISNLAFSNSALGIDLGASGTTPNDDKDIDSGANELQNSPLLTSITSSTIGDSVPGSLVPAAVVNASGIFNSTPNTTFILEFFFGSNCQGAGHQFIGSIPIRLGSREVITDNNGNASFTFTFEFPSGFSSGWVNGTATNPAGNTSEYCQCIAVTSPNSPRITNAVVSGKKLIIDGTNLARGTTILLNGQSQKTKYESSSRIIGKKAGKKVKPNDRIQVRNPDGTLSNEITYQALQ